MPPEHTPGVATPLALPTTGPLAAALPSRHFVRGLQGTVETLPYRPAAHALHATAPDAFNVFVTEPAWHTVQLV